MKPWRALFVLSAAAPLSVAAGCVNPHVRDADALARSGDWEGALARYLEAQVKHPEDKSIARRINQASIQVIVLYTERGYQANASGHLDQAAADWHKAIDLCSPKANPPECSGAFQAIDDNQSAIEYAGDTAAGEGRWEDAIGAYGALVRVDPELSGIAEKQQNAEKGYAAELQAQAETLAKDHLLGAALVTDMKALQHDPMQPEAYRSGSLLKRSIRARTKVAVQDLVLTGPGQGKGKGHPAFGKAVVAALRPHLDDYAPYGPTRDPEAQKATFKATVVDYQAHDLTMSGVDESRAREVPNPAVAARKKEIERLDHQLAQLKRHGGKAKELASTRARLAKARAVLAALPATITDRSAETSWTDVTRSVTATVRFQLEEAGAPEPIVLEVSHEAHRTARIRKGEPSELPSYATLAAEVAAQFRDGAVVLEQARDRRVEKLLADGRAALVSGHQPEALDAFVEVLFMRGVDGLPEDAAATIARSLERVELGELVAMN